MVYFDSTFFLIIIFSFYLIGIFLIILVLNSESFKKTIKSEPLTSFLTKKKKFMLLIFSLIFISVFTSFYIQPGLSLEASLVTNLILIIFMGTTFYFIFYHYFKEKFNPSGHDLKNKSKIKLLAIVCAFTFAVALVIDGIFSQSIISIFLLIIFSSIFYFLILKAVILFINENFTSNYAIKTKSIIFALMMLIFFSLFSVQTLSVVNSNNLIGQPYNANFSPDSSKIVFTTMNNFVSGVITSLPPQYIGIYDIQTKSLKFFQCPDYYYFLHYQFINDSFILIYSWADSILQTYPAIMNINSGKITNLTKIISPFADIPANNIEIWYEGIISNDNVLIDQFKLQNMISNSYLTVNATANSNNILDAMQYFVSPDLKNMDIFSLENGSYSLNVYSINKTTNPSLTLEKRIENVVPNDHLDLVRNEHLFNFITSDNNSLLFYSFFNLDSNSTELFSYNYKTQNTTLLFQIPSFNYNFQFTYINTSQDSFLTNVGQYSYNKEKMILIPKFTIDLNSNTLSLTQYDTYSTKLENFSIFNSSWIPTFFIWALEIMEYVDFGIIGVLVLTLFYFSYKNYLMLN